MATKKATKRRVNSDRRMFVLHTTYRSGTPRLLVFEARDDARDARDRALLRKNVTAAVIYPATRGASNTRRG